MAEACRKDIKVAKEKHISEIIKKDPNAENKSSRWFKVDNKWTYAYSHGV